MKITQSSSLFRSTTLVLSLSGVLLGCTTPRTSELSPAELQQIAKDRLTRVVASEQEPVTKSIDLYEAMARALKYNLDQKVEYREQILRGSEFDVESYDMLPDVALAANFSGRDNNPGSFSIDVPNGDSRSEVATRSSEREQANADLTLSWDMLDYALARVRSQQASDEIWIAREQRRATINRVIEDVRTAYWRAVSAQRLDSRIDRLEKSAQQALAQAYAQERQQVGDPLDALTYQREVLGILRSIQELRRDLGIAKNQLAALMNLPQNQRYSVVVPSHASLDAPIIHADPMQLVRLAVQNRPELREVSYRQRINDLENDAALAEIIPDLGVFVGLNWTSNDLIYNNDWVDYGADTSWNLMNIFRLKDRRRVIKDGDALLDARALALTQAVSAQVFVARARLESLRTEADIARRYHNTSDRISIRTRAAVSAGSSGQRDAVREEMNAVLGSLRYDATYAELQTAFANLYSAIGLDPYSPELDGNESVDEMAAVLRNLWAQRGDKMALKE
ncbi:TolC family protein [Sagittula sp. SSi028]|uniref:TolC family protein n=1 Tax=Sagittula sp. SSi028 TaxID=3400636 RepID=UPI003AF80E18